MESIGKIRRKLHQKFGLEKWLPTIRDGRIRPRIQPGEVAQAMIEMVPRQQESMLAVDQTMRQPEILSYYGSLRPMVMSDSTIWRSVREMSLAPIHKKLWDIGRWAVENERCLSRLPSGRRIRLGIIDGSQWGDFLGSVLVLAGDRQDIVTGYAKSPGRGHELATSRKVKAEARKELGSGFVDMIAGDGLYMNTEDLRWCPEQGGCHGLIKTTEETLDVVQDAKGIFGSAEFEGGIERREGMDVERGVQYKIEACGGFSWHGMTLKVARVWEKAVKPRKNRPAEETFWVITTDETLSAEDMREIGHLRWRIENRTFRRLNALVGSKRRWTTNAHACEVLLGLWFIGLDLLGVSWTLVSRCPLKPILRTAKKTWLWLGRMFAREILLEYAKITV